MLAFAQQNFQDRKAIIVNVSPHIELSEFSFQNTSRDRRDRFEQGLTWKNIGKQPVVATEIIVLKYDPFDQRQIGTRLEVQGKNSVDWSPLQPGEQARDGTIEIGHEGTYTAVAYVRAVRLVDGTVWRVNEGELAAKLRQVVPGIRDFGSLKPDPKSPEK
jgi:hypothetical protein